MILVGVAVVKNTKSATILIDFMKLTYLSSKITLYTVLIVGIIISIFLSSWVVLHNDLGFNTDIARDFLLIEDIVTSHKLTLIGAKTGGIPGLFHGPLWLYMNVPAFIIGQGNPIIVGWFWVFLTVVFIWVTYYVGTKLFNTKIGLLAGLIVALLSVPYAGSLYNPFGAVILFPIFFYFFWKYLEKKRFLDITIAYFLLGCIIQFQVAFGAPLLLLTTGYFLYTIYKTKKYLHLFSLGILILPLSTYILFDVRHDFLQLRAVADHITGKQSTYMTLPIFIRNRLEGFVYSATFIPSNWYILLAFGGIFYGLFIKKMSKNSIYTLYFYFFLGYWVLSLGFQGYVWSYYYWPFLSMTVIIFCSSIEFLNKKIFSIFYGIMVLTAVINIYNNIINFNNSTGKDISSWKFNAIVSKTIFDQNDSVFGYYIFSTDRYGYSARYAMNYYGRKRQGREIYPYKKMPITYLLISPPGGKETYQDGEWWKYNLVNMPKTSDKVWRFENKYKIEKYLLSQRERAIPADPNLIDSIRFR